MIELIELSACQIAKYITTRQTIKSRVGLFLVLFWFVFPIVRVMYTDAIWRIRNVTAHPWHWQVHWAASTELPASRSYSPGGGIWLARVAQGVDLRRK